MSVAGSAKALRAFFRHAAARGWCADSIAAGIDGPRLFRQEGLPSGPAWPEVKRLIASTTGDSARDIRDHAILIMLAMYGLRSSEVIGLRLEDVNWERETVLVTRSKQRRSQEYPLVSEAGEAILRYLQRVRPRSAEREIFLTFKAPFRRLSPGIRGRVVPLIFARLTLPLTKGESREAAGGRSQTMSQSIFWAKLRCRNSGKKHQSLELEFGV